MSHRERKDDRRRDYAHDSGPSRRGLGSGRERERHGDPNGRRRSRSISPKRRDDRDRRDGECIFHFLFNMEADLEKKTNTTEEGHARGHRRVVGRENANMTDGKMIEETEIEEQTETRIKIGGLSDETAHTNWVDVNRVVCCAL